MGNSILGEVSAKSEAPSRDRLGFLWCGRHTVLSLEVKFPGCLEAIHSEGAELSWRQQQVTGGLPDHSEGPCISAFGQLLGLGGRKAPSSACRVSAGAGAGAGEQEVWAVVCSLGWAGAPVPRAEPLQVRPRARNLPLRMSWWVCSGTAYSLGHVQAQVRSRKPKTAV